MSGTARFVGIGGSLNFRHLGGYRARDGVTRADALFRGGWFDLASAEDEDRFAAAGIRRIFDFRSPPERQKRPLSGKVARQADIVELGISPGSMGPYLLSLRDLPAAQVDCRGAMTRMHYEMLTEGTPRFRQFFQHLAASEGPVMIMCSTGKDRTGVASALLLSALGVPRETIFEDYMISAEVYRGKELDFARSHGLEALGVDLDLVKDVFTVHPDYLEAVWRRIDETAGSMDRFLAEAMGLDADGRRRLQDVFLER
jgi:protein-tyrosine phosphatase